MHDSVYHMTILKDIIVFKMKIISLRNRFVDTVFVSDATCYYTCRYTIFMTRRYLLSGSDVIDIGWNIHPENVTCL